MGGGTTKVGDPSGKDESRKLLDEVAIEKNINGIQQIFAKFQYVFAKIAHGASVLLLRQKRPKTSKIPIYVPRRGVVYSLV